MHRIDKLLKKMTLKKRKRVTRFKRSTQKSDRIGHNYMVMRSLQTVAENCKNNKHVLLLTLSPFLVTSSSGSKYVRMEEEVFLETCQKLNKAFLADPECGEVTCNVTSPFRTISGCCNNIVEKHFGQTNRAFLRLLPNAYDDSISIPRGGINPTKLPSPRDISAAVHGVQETENRPAVSVMLMQFGQFLDHDITLTPEQGL